MIPIVSAEEQRRIEATAFASGLPEGALTDRAADALVGHVLRELPPGGLALLIAGPGNNGLDAVKVHRRLLEQSVRSTLSCWRRRDCEGLRSDDLDALVSTLRDADLVLDGLFGIGLTRPVEGELAQVLSSVQSERLRRGADKPLTVVGLDVPSGLQSDSGEVLGTALPADVTVTLGLLKLGLYVGDGPALAGEIRWEAIGLDEIAVSASGATGFDSTEALQIPPRAVGSHKNDNGRVLLIGGSLRYPLAPVIAARAAQRAGAGYVTVGFPRSLLGPIAAHLLEQTLLPLAESDIGALGPYALDDAREHAPTYKSLVIGNGLGREEKTQEFLMQLLGMPAALQKRSVGFRSTAGQAPAREPEEESRPLPPTLVDGDGLFALAQQEGWWESAPAIRLLTPHPGEMATLTGRSVDEVEADRAGAARDAARQWGKVVILKGDHPIVASPDGAIEIMTEAHPELGTAGTGDVLAGLGGYMLALGLEPQVAARYALVLGARAAAIAAARVGRDCVCAGDLIEALPEARGRG